MTPHLLHTISYAMGLWLGCLCALSRQATLTTCVRCRTGMPFVQRAAGRYDACRPARVHSHMSEQLSPSLCSPAPFSPSFLVCRVAVNHVKTNLNCPDRAPAPMHARPATCMHSYLCSNVLCSISSWCNDTSCMSSKVTAAVFSFFWYKGLRFRV